MNSLKTLYTQTPRKTLIKYGVVLIIFLGWFFSAWGGGIMGLWACFCTGAVGFVLGVYSCNGVQISIAGPEKKDAISQQIDVPTLTVVEHERAT